MSSTFDNPFLTPTPAPTTTTEGQQNWGTWERKNGYTPEPQKSYETYDSFLTRINK